MWGGRVGTLAYTYMLKIHDLAGVIPALATPLTRDGGVDEAGVERLVGHVLAGGVAGLLPLGSTGECSSLDEGSRRAMLAAVVQANAGRVPVICGVAQTHLAAAQLEVAAAAALGADAALVTPPFYYPMDQAGVLAFYRTLARRSPIPILLYNIPQFTKVVAEPETVATLAREGSLVGIKDSSRNFEYFELDRASRRSGPSDPSASPVRMGPADKELPARGKLNSAGIPFGGCPHALGCCSAPRDTSQYGDLATGHRGR